MESINRTVYESFGQEATAKVIVTFESAELAQAYIARHPEFLPGLKGRTVRKRVPMTVSKAQLASVATAAGVVSVFPDVKVHAALNSSVPAMGGTYFRDTCGYSGAGVKVAVLDTGYTLHIALQSRILTTANFTSAPTVEDIDGHGNHVAGTIASTDVTYRGVAPGAQLLIAKVLTGEGSGDTSDIIEGVEWAVEQGAQVINMSLGSPGSSDGTDPLSQVCDEAVAAGAVVVVSAGNTGPGSRTIGAPAAARNVITVGAAADNGTIADFSSRGPTADGRVKPDVLCTGVDVTAPIHTGGFGTKSGTSMSAPHVSGLVALMLEARPELTPEAVKTLIMSAATSIGLSENSQGRGIIRGDNLFSILGSGMTVRLSTGLRNGLATDRGLLEMLQFGVIDVYDGEQPLEADRAPIGTRVGRITQDGATFSHGQIGGGLAITGSADGVSKTGIWTFRGVATGTARWFRWKANALDTNETSTLFFRLDGRVGTDLVLQQTQITPGLQMDIQSFTVRFNQ